MLGRAWSLLQFAEAFAWCWLRLHKKSLPSLPGCIALHHIASLAAGLGSDTVALLGAYPVSAWTPAASSASSSMHLARSFSHVFTILQNLIVSTPHKLYVFMSSWEANVAFCSCLLPQSWHNGAALNPWHRHGTRKLWNVCIVHSTQHQCVSMMLYGNSIGFPIKHNQFWMGFWFSHFTKSSYVCPLYGRQPYGVCLML